MGEELFLIVCENQVENEQYGARQGVRVTISLQALSNAFVYVFLLV